jgi:prepilin-type N-terminal cleavage/methylation domain-containing protein
MRRIKAAKRRGFTLIEVMAATMVLTVGLMAAFYLVGLGTSVNTDSKTTAQAYQAAQQEIEILRNIPYATINTISRTSEGKFVTSTGGNDASSPSDTGYPGLVPGLKKLPNGRGGLIMTGTDYKNITVIVRWTDPGSVERKVVVGTIIAEGGIDPR